MKLEKNKHDHSLTKILKVATFGIFLLLPFGAIASSCAYSIFNENASEQVNHITYEQPTELIHGEKYKINIPTRLQDKEFEIYFSDYSNIETTTTKSNSTLDRKQFAMSDNYYYISFNYDLYNYFIGKFEIVFDYANGDYTDLLPYMQWEHHHTETIDQRNSFYYACEQVKEQPIFAWTKETTTYETFKLVMQGFNNPDDTLPIILTYMLMTTCIYLIIDIVIEMTTWITHMITGNKN